MKKLRYNYFNNIDAIIYVIDSSDDYRIDIDSEDIQQLLKEDKLKKQFC